MWVHEYQVKELLHQHGVPVLKGIAVFSIQEAIEAAQKLGGEHWCVKVQTHAPKLGKYKQIVRSFEALKKQVTRFLGEPLNELTGTASEKKVRRLLVEEYTAVEKMFSLSIAVDDAQRKPVISFGAQGVKKRDQMVLDILDEVSVIQLRSLIDHVDMPEKEAQQIAEIGQQLYTFFQKMDAVLLHVTMGLVKHRERIELIDVQVCFDDHALFRQPQINVLRDLDEEDPRELEASFYNMHYTDFQGHIGCLTNGAGVAAVLLEMFQSVGSEGANFVSMEGVITEERMTAAFEIMQKNKEMRVILINMVSEIHSCGVIASFIINACKTLNLRKPLVVRLKGVGEDEGRLVLNASSLGVNWADSLIEAVQKAVVLGG